MSPFVAALDQGTTSTRCLIFNAAGEIVGREQREHEQIYPKPGWVEHDPLEIAERAEEVLRGAAADAGLELGQLTALGITNQRETTVVWDRRTGRPYANAIVWQDMRTAELCERLGGEFGPERFRDKTGLPLATYFSGPKLRWLLDNIEGLREAAERGDALFGTIDSWLIWNLTGGTGDATVDGAHVTDPTNASRTMLMNLKTLDWDDELLVAMDIPRRMLPTIRPSSDPSGYGLALGQVPIHGALGDQQAALVGQACFSPGEAKCTYGTGCFLLQNTGTEPVRSKHGLLTTLAYKFGDEPPVYALEGSIAIAGALLQWLRDNLGLVEDAAEVGTLAAQVEDSGGMYIVPAFSGLFAPHWRADARGVMVGLTRYIDKRHICRAALEATAFQVREVLEAMNADAGSGGMLDGESDVVRGARLRTLKVDGGMVASDLLMQFQSDLLDLPVERPAVSETTALGAAYAAGLATGVWGSPDEVRAQWRMERRWESRMDAAARAEHTAGWEKAVARSVGWVEAEG